MKRRIAIIALTLAAIIPAAAFAQHGRIKSQGFASDFQTVPVMGNTPGLAGANFQTYVTILNPTANAFAVEVTLFDNAGTKRTATINLAAGELKTYQNFLDAVFGLVGGGAVQFRSPESAGGSHDNRFIVNAEIWTAGASRYGTSLPTLEFAGTSSRSFSPGVSVGTGSRANVGCFNQSDAANAIKATVYDASGKVVVGTVNLNLPANAWGQAGITSVVSNGYVQFDPSDSAVCYAVVVDNTTNDGNFIAATEYRP
ncbi:MAG: hypothetical protein JWO97_902 [Acidobacteria bacterium]|nr:hypothetical protein [Acidobacteriota bacterium]